MTTEKIEISGVDIRGNQILMWVFTFLSALPFSIALFLNLNWNNFGLTAIVYAVNFFIQRQNAKLWNVWYENGEVVLKNIYSKKVKAVRYFEKTVMTSVLLNQYNIYFNDGDNDKYYFWIKPTQNIALLFRKDNQYYARQINEKLQEVKDSMIDR